MRLIDIDNIYQKDGMETQIDVCCYNTTDNSEVEYFFKNEYMYNFMIDSNGTFDL